MNDYEQGWRDAIAEAKRAIQINRDQDKASTTHPLDQQRWASADEARAEDLAAIDQIDPPEPRAP